MNKKNILKIIPLIYVFSFLVAPYFAQARSSATLPASGFNTKRNLTKSLLSPQGLGGFPLSSVQKSTKKKNEKDDKKKQQKNIYLNFENTALTNFVNYMAEMKKLNLIPDKSLSEAKVSLTIRDPLSIDGAWNVFLTVLEMAGFTIVKVGDVHKVIPKDQKLTQPLPAYINVPSHTLPDSDETIRYVVFLQNLNIDAVKDLLASMLSDKHSIIPQKEANGYIITDKSYNIKSAMRLIHELDKSGQPEAVVVLKLQRTNATDVKELLNALIKKSEGSPIARMLGKNNSGTTEYFPPGTRIIAEERTNSLILLGLTDSIKKIEDFITNHVDTELKSAESPLHIYELQYTDATQIATILKEVTAAPDSGPGQQASRYGAIRGGVKYFKSMNFQVDKDGNRLIVSSTDKEDWDLLKKTIDDLDKPQPQVAIETMFVSINARDLKNLGGMLHSKKHGRLGNHVDFQSAALSGNTSLKGDEGSFSSLLGGLIGQLTADQGATLLTFGKATNIWAVFQAFKEKNNISILSQPFLTISNKTIGKIEVGEDLQVVQEEGTDGSKGFATVSSTTSVELEPQINLDGIIRMQVSVNIEDFINRDRGDKETKQLKTNVTIADGQVLVLGGFVKTKVEETKTKTPLLGDIPILGWLFKNQKRTIDKSYIFVFISPTIIKPRQLPGIGLYTKTKMHQATKNIEKGVTTVKTHDPIFNWFFDPKKENYSHKVVDFANARYQPTVVDIKNDPYYRVHTTYDEAADVAKGEEDDDDYHNKSTEEENSSRLVPSTHQQLLPKPKMIALSTMKKSKQKKRKLRKKRVKKLEKPRLIKKVGPSKKLAMKSSFPMATKAVSKKSFVQHKIKPISTPVKTNLHELAKKPILNTFHTKKASSISDEHLEERREHLKKVLSRSSLRARQPLPSQNNSKTQMKNFIAQDPKTRKLKDLLTSPAVNQPPLGPLNVDSVKRKSLKKLFSKNQMRKLLQTSNERTS